MKVKKDQVKIKKKKNKLETIAKPNIKKIKKSKVKKVENDSEVAEAVKKGFEESKKDGGSRIPQRQQTWLEYLKVFLTSEQLNDAQKLIMEFCTNKGLTPPRRKQKFLHFIRNSYVNQKDVSDELCFELFDLLHDKYEDFKGGKYSKSDNNVDSADGPSTAKPSKNKKKKLNKLANNISKNSSPVKKEPAEGKWEKTKSKKKRKQKVPTDSSGNEEDMETDE